MIELNTSSGEERERPAEAIAGWTRIPVDLPVMNTCCYALSLAPLISQKPIRQREVGRLPAPSRVELLEDNVLLLDRASWRVNDGDWQEADQVLRVDNFARRSLGCRSGMAILPSRGLNLPVRTRIRLPSVLTCMSTRHHSAEVGVRASR